MSARPGSISIGAINHVNSGREALLGATNWNQYLIVIPRGRIWHLRYLRHCEPYIGSFLSFLVVVAEIMIRDSVYILATNVVGYRPRVATLVRVVFLVEGLYRRDNSLRLHGLHVLVLL